MKQFLAKYRKTEGAACVARIDFYKINGVIFMHKISDAWGGSTRIVDKVPSAIKGYYNIGLE